MPLIELVTPRKQTRNCHVCNVIIYLLFLMPSTELGQCPEAIHFHCINSNSNNNTNKKEKKKEEEEQQQRRRRQQQEQQQQQQEQPQQQQQQKETSRARMFSKGSIELFLDTALASSTSNCHHLITARPDSQKSCFVCFCGCHGDAAHHCAAKVWPYCATPMLEYFKKEKRVKREREREKETEREKPQKQDLTDHAGTMCCGTQELLTQGVSDSPRHLRGTFQHQQQETM
jgi:hypothetical protein